MGEELLKKFEREGRAPATLTKLRWLLQFVFDAFGDRPIAEITAPEILLPLRRIEARGNYETARRLRSTCGMVFRYAIATGRGERDPSADLQGALITPKVRHRAAIIEPNAIGSLLRAIDQYAQTRAFCYVDDLVDGLIRLSETPHEIPGPINLGNPGEFTIRALVELVIELTNSKSRIVLQPLPPDDLKQRRPDINLAAGTLRWKPNIELREGLRRTIAYFQ